MKRTTLFSSLLTAALGLVMAGPASATDYTWTGNSGDVATDNDWRVNANWRPSTGYPGSGDTATIPDVVNDPVIDQQDEAVKILTIEHDGLLTVTGQTLTISGTGGYLDIDPVGGGTLVGRLVFGASGVVVLSGTGTHDIDGHVLMSGSSSILRFSTNDTTIDGDGYIQGSVSTAQIELADVDLTNEMLIQGMMTIEESLGTSSFINGATGTVQANAAGILLLHSNLESISDADNASWDAIASGATLQFDVGASCLKGDFLISNCAKLKLVGIDITTEGSVTKTAGQIVLDNSATLKENLVNCASGDPVSAGFFGGCS